MSRYANMNFYRWINFNGCIKRKNVCQNTLLNLTFQKDWYWKNVLQNEFVDIVFEKNVICWNQKIMFVGKRSMEHPPPGKIGGKLSHRGIHPRPRILLNSISQANWLSGITSLRFWIRFAKISSPRNLKKENFVAR